MYAAQKEKYIEIAREVTKPNFEPEIGSDRYHHMIEKIFLIYLIFQDGNWHSYQEISEKTGYSEKYCNEQILPLLKKAWNLTTDSRKGYKLERL